MAIYHFAAQVISRSAGRSATAAAAYRAGERIHDERTGQTFDYGKKSGVEHTGIMAPANAPDWVHDRAKLWNAVEHGEKRKDAQVCREIEMALPVELNNEQQLELVRGFVKQRFVRAGMVADIAIHRPKQENPHCHVLLTMRDIGPDGFGQKNRSWNDKQLLETWREQWAEHTNRALERAGHSARVDHRTLEAQGIDRVPQIHIGPKTPEMERRGIRTERGTAALEIDAKNAAIAALKSELEAARNERNHENPASPHPRADRRGPGADGREHGRAGRPVERSGQDVERGQLPGHPRDAAAGQHGRVVGAGAGRSVAENGPEHGRAGRPVAEGAEAGGLGHSSLDAGLSHPRSHASDRIRALAGTPAPGSKHPQPARVGPVPGPGIEGGDTSPAGPARPRPAPPLDRSYLAARRQLAAMGGDVFEIGIRDRQGRMLLRTWDAAEVLENLPWLKSQNARGADVYVRPAGGFQENPGVVLVDDLDAAALARMKGEGFAPAAVTETSPGNFQAWVRLSKTPLPSDVATTAAAVLATRYGGDPNSADWRHFGRLAGLTNNKPHHRDQAGRAPYVLAHDSTGNPAPAGPGLVAEARQQVRQREAQAEAERRRRHVKHAVEPRKGADPIEAYRYGLKALYARFGPSMDMSRADFMIGVDMARQGYNADQIGRAIEQASPELPTRKAGHEADYVARTVKAVMTEHQQRMDATREAVRQMQPPSPRRPSRDCDRGPSL